MESYTKIFCVILFAFCYWTVAYAVENKYTCNACVDSNSTENMKYGHSGRNGTGNIYIENECKTEQRKNCTGCQKIFTSSNHEMPGGQVFKQTIYISRTCMTVKPPFTQDDCDKDGSKAEYSITCYCFSNLCNAAPAIIHSTLSVILSIIPSLFLVYLVRN